MGLDGKAQEVFEWYDSKWNLPTPFSKKRPLTIDTSLSTGRHPWAREEGDLIMNEFFDKFSVKRAGFDFLKYWPYERGFIPNFLLPKSQRVYYIEPEPLTITMLIESAKAGRWLY
ncbi:MULTISPECIES: DUF1493 family protein [unclassified Serratia (in: enterobacteria)]|uniref:DUF1493 family protein n=1 Tax=unclassified Serratia (in: enterobacteria) TaxID=2647522 RepID=UPI00050228C8|nr:MULTISPECIES: DUF1493 family protein [unclassified Serratia (in: enterobacteria)]KFK97548.1 hypothetical protein JV45_01620 [Serratia sp. Ag2]KFK98144.1 hypothetical protein IV04_14735 [Serratia sp. Ag1]